LIEFKPHAYQKKAIQFGLDHERCGLLLPMGAGKTVTTLTILNELIGIEVARILIIGPVRVIKSTWPDEIQKWSHTKDIKFSVVAGTAKQRKNALQVDAQIYLIGKENVTWLVEQNLFDFDMVVIDELSTFKNPGSKRFKALRKMMPLTERFIGLTGTPAPKGVPDLWAQIYLMDQGERLGRTLSEFRARYLKPGRQNGHVVYDWKVRDSCEELIYERISDICMSLDQKDCAELPPVQYIKVKASMTEKTMKAYTTFKREKVLEFESNEELMAVNAGVLCGQLLQMTSGEIYIKDEFGDNVGTKVIHDAKLNSLDDLIESANGNPVMVFYYYRHELSRIKAHLKAQGLNVRALSDEKDVRDWNNGDVDVLLIHPASAGHGLNLQQGGHIAVWYTLPNWNLELYQQANARIYRQGQKENVSIYQIIVPGTIDEDMLKALDEKDVTQKRLIEALRR
jgi:SNF2 family DNA or RNA helicase